MFEMFNARVRAQTLVAVTAVALAVCVIGPAEASAGTIAVSPAGSDANDGSIAAPLATVSKAAAIARSGDTVLVHSGRYRETLSLSSRHNGVVFRGVGETRPIIDGEGTRAYGFKNVNGHDVTIEGFEVTGQVEAGIYSLGTENVIAGNLLHHIGSATETHSNGIRVVWGGSARVVGNTIHHIGPGSESMGIWLVETRDARVEENVVYLVRKEGIRDWKGLDNSITSNRIFLNWAGISLNTSTGTAVTNNYVYDNVEGLVAKHLSYRTVLEHWGLAEGRWATISNNTVYRSSEASLWIAQSDAPLDYLEVRDNVFAGAGYAYIRDRSSLRGPNVTLDGNAYAEGDGRPRYLYKEGWSSSPGLNDWAAIRAATGWETQGGSSSLALDDPARGDLGSPSPLGARSLAGATVAWTPFAMTAVDSSSKGTYYTEKHLQKSADGDQASYWLTATNRDEYVVYDFGQERTFNHLVLTVFSHFDRRAARGYRFEVSDDRQTWRTVLEGTNQDAAGSAHPYELPAPASARYLRFTMLDSFCQSYTPRTNCGADFVLSDLKAGLVSEVEAAAPAPDGPAPPPDGPAPAPPPASPEPGPANPPAPAPLPPQAPVPLPPRPPASAPAAAPAPRVPASPPAPAGDPPVAPRANGPETRTPLLRILRRGARIRRGRLWIRVACGEPSARGPVRITLSSLGDRGSVGARVRTLARARMTIRSGCRRMIGIRIDRSSLRRLDTRGPLRIRAVVRLPDGQATSTVFRVRRPARSSRR